MIPLLRFLVNAPFSIHNLRKSARKHCSFLIAVERDMYALAAPALPFCFNRPIWKRKAVCQAADKAGRREKPVGGGKTGAGVQSGGALQTFRTAVGGRLSGARAETRDLGLLHAAISLLIHYEVRVSPLLLCNSPLTDCPCCVLQSVRTRSQVRA